MLLLTATTHTLGIDTSTTSEVVYTASYVDITTTTFTPSSSSGSITTVTDTTLVSAPGSSTQRQIKYLSFYNAHASVSNVITIYKKISSTEYPILKIELAAGATLEYVDGQGFKLFSTSSGGGAVDSVNGQTGVVVLDADDIDDSATTNKFVTAADITKLGNTSGTNSGDQNLFSTIAVSGQSDVVADSATDTLTLVAGSNITLTTNATTDTITIAASGGGSQTPWTSDIETAGYKLVNATTGDGVILEATTKVVINTPALEVRSTSAGQAGNIYIYEGSSYGTNSISLKAPNILAADWVMTLPPDNGNSGEFLQTDGSGNTIWAAGGGSLSDGDYGDVTVSSSGTVFTIDNDAVTYAKIQNVSATDKLLGRSTSGAGDIEEIACTAAGRALLDDANAAAQRVTLGVDGKMIKQRVYAQYNAVGTTTGLIPADNTIPQNTEGGEFMTLAITPTNSSNILEIKLMCQIAASTVSTGSVALFQDSTANALAVCYAVLGGVNYSNTAGHTHTMVAGTTSATTFKVRAGLNLAGTLTFNGVGGVRNNGGINNSYLVITEYEV